MIAEHEIEPIRGLPGRLPPGERILWQGRPDARTLARHVLHARAIAIYFVALIGVAIIAGTPFGIAATALSGVIAVALLHLLAWAMARSTIYTLTNRRLVMRIGVALSKCINLPLSAIEAVDLADRGDGHGDIALAVKGAQAIGYAGLWPHARPWRLARPQPMLRAVEHADRVGAMIARHCTALTEAPAAAPAPIHAVAA